VYPIRLMSMTQGLGAATVVLAAAALGARAQDAAPSPPDLRARVDAYLEPLVEMGMFSGAVLLAKDFASGDATTAAAPLMRGFPRTMVASRR